MIKINEEQLSELFLNMAFVIKQDFIEEANKKTNIIKDINKPYNQILLMTLNFYIIRQIVILKTKVIKPAIEKVLVNVEETFYESIVKDFQNEITNENNDLFKALIKEKSNIYNMINEKIENNKKKQIESNFLKVSTDVIYYLLNDNQSCAIGTFSFFSMYAGCFEVMVEIIDNALNAYEGIES